MYKLPYESMKCRFLLIDTQYLAVYAVGISRLTRQPIIRYHIISLTSGMRTDYFVLRFF